MKKILLDTDIGSDIDDAVCLAYLLSQPECELTGITTVSGEPVKRAILADALCRAAGREIPIYPGMEKPLLRDQCQPKASQFDAIGRWPHRTEFPRGEAVEFMRRTIRQNPGEITLLAIGPMTNVAALFSVDPEIPGLLAGLVLMCGVFTRPGEKEWNALCDPHAAAIVYGAPACVHRSVGLDVTLQLVMPKEEVRRRFTAAILRPVLDFAGVWYRSADRIIFHDPLAAVSVFEPSVCTYARGSVGVSYGRGAEGGETVWRPDDRDGRNEVALGVDADGFFRHYFSVVR